MTNSKTGAGPALLRRAAVLTLLALLATVAFPQLQPPAVAAPRVSGKVVAKEFRHGSPATRPGTREQLGGASAQPESGTTGRETLAYTSEVIDAGQRFNFVGMHWRAIRGAEDALFFEVRTSADGTAWSEWEMRFEEEDMRDLERNELYAAPINVGNARYLQYRVWATNGDLRSARSVGLTVMDVSDLNASPVSRLANDLLAAVNDLGRSFGADAAVRAPTIRTRQDWGCGEQCESALDWIPDYEPWQKAVVHHTVTSNTYTDPTAEIRAIWYFHAFTRGWTDIGYNYVVDRFGQIWQGRQGGDDSVGGHALGWNRGSMGVAALGHFSTVAPSAELLNGIAQIIALKFAQRGIQPLGSDTYTHQEQDSSGNWVPVTSNPPNIVGHRDCSFKIGIVGGQTACPGQVLYNEMNTIRQNAQAMFNDGFTHLAHYTTELPRRATVNKTLSVPVTVKNTGRTTISRSGTSVSYRIVSGTTGSTVLAQGSLTPLTVDIAPGASTTVNVSFGVPSTAGRYVVRWDLFIQGQGWASAVLGTATRDQWLRVLEWDVRWISDTTPDSMVVGRATNVNVTLVNASAHAWPAGSVGLSYHWRDPATWAVVDWDGNRGILPSDLQPEQQATVPISVRAPTSPGRYVLEYDVVWEGQFWLSWRGALTLDQEVAVPFDFRARYDSAPASLSLVANEERTVAVTVTNTGTTLWPAGTGAGSVRLGQHWYTSSGALLQFDGPRTALPGDVAPGASVTFQAKVRAPATPGSYQLHWDLVLEGTAWFSWRGGATAVTGLSAREPAYGARYEPGAVPALVATFPFTVPLTLTNTGDIAWSQTDFALSYHWSDATFDRLLTWDGERTLLAGAVDPGQAVTLRADLLAPASAGTYRVRWDMVHERVTWFSWKGVPTAAQTVSVAAPSYAATYDMSRVPTSLPTGRDAVVTVGITNTSNFGFSRANGIRLSYHWYDASDRLVVWDGLRTEIDVPVGGTVAVAAAVRAPSAAGTYRLRFDLVREGVTWFSWRGIPEGVRAVSVGSADYWATYAVGGAQTGGTDKTIVVPVTVTNTGTRTWSNTEIFLSYHLHRDGSLYVWDGLRSQLPASLAPGQSSSVNAQVRLPKAAGTYEARFDLVREGVTWFSWLGVPTASVIVTAE